MWVVTSTGRSRPLANVIGGLFSPKEVLSSACWASQLGTKQTLDVLNNVFKLDADIPTCIAINLFPYLPKILSAHMPAQLTGQGST